MGAGFRNTKRQRAGKGGKQGREWDQLNKPTSEESSHQLDQPARVYSGMHKVCTRSESLIHYVSRVQFNVNIKVKVRVRVKFLFLFLFYYKK